METVFTENPALGVSLIKNLLAIFGNYAMIKREGEQ